MSARSASICNRRQTGCAICYVPDSTPAQIVAETEAPGAKVVRVAGTIADARRALALVAEAKGWFLLSTLREPYRIEGKKV